MAVLYFSFSQCLRGSAVLFFQSLALLCCSSSLCIYGIAVMCTSLLLLLMLAWLTIDYLHGMLIWTCLFHSTHYRWIDNGKDLTLTTSGLLFISQGSVTDDDYILEQTNDDDMLNCYNNIINEILDEQAPFTCRRRWSDPWYDTECRTTKQSTSKLERQYKKHSIEPTVQHGQQRWKRNIERLIEKGVHSE